jgi:D-galactose 1-dehydrogenase
MSKRKIAIIGLGKISQDQHVPVIAASDAFELAAIVSTRGLGHGGRAGRSRRRPSSIARCRTSAWSRSTPRRRAPRDRPRSAGGRQGRAAGETAGDHLVGAGRPGGVREPRSRVLFATWHSIFNPGGRRGACADRQGRLRSLHIEWREDVKKWHPGQDWVWEPGGFGVFDPGINALSILTHILPSIAFVKSADLTYPVEPADADRGRAHPLRCQGHHSHRRLRLARKGR